MRRSDREITEIRKIEEFIATEQIIRVAFYDEGDIYIVPVNYVYVQENGCFAFYFHGAQAGRKYELTKNGANVGFEIDGKYQLLEGETACDCTAKFQSVIGTGRLCLAEGDEKMKGLQAIMKQTTHKTEWTYHEELLKAVAVFRLDVDKISCKAK